MPSLTTPFLIAALSATVDFATVDFGQAPPNVALSVAVFHIGQATSNASSNLELGVAPGQAGVAFGQAGSSPPATPATAPSPEAAPGKATPPAGESTTAKPAIPADAERATQALVDSPRHGEWVDVPLDPAEPKGPSLKTWVSYPETKDKAPVVLVIHEIFGLTDWVRAVADQLAAEGFIAVAPDLLSGKGPEGGATESFSGDAVREAIRKLDPKEVVARLDRARAYALALPAAAPRSACMGFCWGGSTTFTYVTLQPSLDAAVVWYGTAPTDKGVLAKISCPVLGLYGGDDARVTSTVEETGKLMAEVGKSFRPLVFEGAGHGFLRQQTGRDGANLKAAREAWAETLTLLRAQFAVPKPAAAH